METPCVGDGQLSRFSSGDRLRSRSHTSRSPELGRYTDNAPSNGPTATVEAVEGALLDLGQEDGAGTAERRDRFLGERLLPLEQPLDRALRGPRAHRRCHGHRDH